jgi:hypothetical protein
MSAVLRGWVLELRKSHIRVALSNERISRTSCGKFPKANGTAAMGSSAETIPGHPVGEATEALDFAGEK